MALAESYITHGKDLLSPENVHNIRLTHSHHHACETSVAKEEQSLWDTHNNQIKARRTIKRKRTLE